MNPPTPRQLEIMAAVLRTGSAKIAAAELGIAYSTVKNQQTALFKRLGVTNRCEACAAIYGRRDVIDRERLARALRVAFPHLGHRLVERIAAIADAYEAEARPGRPPLPSPDVLPFDGPDREPSTADSDAPR